MILILRLQETMENTILVKVTNIVSERLRDNT